MARYYAHSVKGPQFLFCDSVFIMLYFPCMTNIYNMINDFRV